MVVKMTAIRPKLKHPGFIMPAMSKGMAEGGEILKKAAEGVTSNWSDRPKFEVHVKLGSSPEQGIICWVTSDDERYNWIDRGTGKWGPRHSAYPIRAKPGRLLAFPSVFTPKTRPNSLQAGPGSIGGPMVYRQTVMHPGIEPRNFTRQIIKEHHAEFARAVSASIAKWRRKG